MNWHDRQTQSVVERFLDLVLQQAAGYPVGVDKKPDFGSTTAVIAYVRRRVTPKILWSAIAALVTCLVVSITWLVNTQSDIHELKGAVADSKEAVTEMRQQLDSIHNIETKLEVMANDVATIKDEVDRQRERWERIEGIAESPPHARRRR